MELRHLRYFVAVAEELSFRRAAERVRVAQPALSKQIKDLEYEVGVRLLDRNTARVNLTDAGGVFLDEARELLERATEAVALAREAEAGRRGNLTVANVNAVCASFMPAALSAFHTRYPEVEVDLQEMMFPDQLMALEQGGVQVGFIVEDAQGIPAHLERFKVLKAEICVAMGRHHRLARRRRVSLHDLANERLLCFEVGKHDLHRKRIREIYAERGLKSGRFKAMNSLESLQAMIEGDQGVSFLAALPRGGQRDIVYRPIKEHGVDLWFELHAVWRRDAVSKLAVNFVNILREVCEPRMAQMAKK